MRRSNRCDRMLKKSSISPARPCAPRRTCHQALFSRDTVVSRYDLLRRRWVVTASAVHLAAAEPRKGASRRAGVGRVRTTAFLNILCYSQGVKS